MAGIPPERDEDGDVQLPGFEADSETDQPGGYWDSSAGAWGTVAGTASNEILGNALSALSKRNEEAVRNALTANTGPFDPWVMAWTGICDVIAQFPFIQGVLDLVPEAETPVKQFFEGIQKVADDICGFLLCDPGASSNSTPTTLLDGIKDGIDGILESPFVSSFLAWVDEIGSNAQSFIFKILDGINYVYQAICSLLTTGNLPGVDGAAPYDPDRNPLEIGNIFADLAAVIGAVFKNPIIVGLVNFVTDAGELTGRVVEDSITGLMKLITDILNLFGLNPENLQNTLQDVMSWITDQLNCIWGALNGVAGATGKTLSDIFSSLQNFLNDVLGLFGIDGDTIPDLIAKIQEILDCLWGILGGAAEGVGKTITDIWNLISGVFSQIGDFFGLDEDTIPRIVSWLTEQLNCVWTTLGGAAAGVAETASGVFSAIGNVVNSILDLFGIDENTISGVVAWVINQVGCIWDTLGVVGDATVKTISGVLDTIATMITTALGWFGIEISTVQDIVDWIGQQITCVWNALAAVGEDVAKTLDGAFSLVGGLFNTVLELFGINETTVAGLLAWIANQINCVWDTLGGAADAAVKTVSGVFGFLTDIINGILGWFGIEITTLQDVIDWIGETIGCVWEVLTGVAGGVGATVENIFAGFNNMVGGLLSNFGAGTLIGDVVQMASNFIGLIGAGVGGAAQAVFSFAQDAVDFVWNGLSFLTGGPVNQSGKTLYDIASIFTGWIWNIGGGLVAGAGTLVQQVVSAITGVAVNLIGDPFALLKSFFSLADGIGTLAERTLETFAQAIGQTGASLFTWALNLINRGNIFDAIKDIWGLLFSVIPIGNINADEEKPNLLSLGAFTTSATLEGKDGWSWDSQNDREGAAVGGAAKLDCTASSGQRTLFSNQNIRVAYGDRVAMSSYVKTLGYNGSSTSITFGVVGFSGANFYNGTLAGSSVTLVSSGARPSWGLVQNDDNSWTVPQGVTSVQAFISVNSTGTAGSVYFDDIKLYKTGLMVQGLVDSLPSAFSGIHDGLKGLTQGTTVLEAGTAANMAQAAASTRSLASGASDAADTAVGNTQNVVDAIAQTAGGNPLATNQPPSTVKSNLSNFMSSLYGPGKTTPQTNISLNAVPTITQAKLGQDSVGNFQIAQNAVTGNEILNGSIGDGKLGSNSVDTAQLKTNSVKNAQIAPDAVTATEILNGSVDENILGSNAVTTAKIRDSAVTGQKTDQLDASKIGSGNLNATLVSVGTLPTQVLPNELKNVGSGVLLRRTTSGATTGYFDPNGYVPNAGFYNSVPANTPDMQIITDSNGRVAVKVLYAGWYMSELSFRLNTTNLDSLTSVTGLFNYNWNFVPGVSVGSLSGTTVAPYLLKFGTNFVYSKDTAYASNPVLQSTFITYIPANQVIQPRYLWGTSTGQQDSIIRGGGEFTYFSVSLLNRSLS